MQRRWFKIGSGIAVGIVTIIGFFYFLTIQYNFIITDLTGDIECEGSYENPCISEFEVKNPNAYNVDIYSSDQVKLGFSPEIYDYALFVKDNRCSATGSCACEIKDDMKLGFEDWRCIDFTNKTKVRQDVTYNYRFSAYSTTKFRIAGLKNNPDDRIKWSFFTNNQTLDPVWDAIKREDIKVRDLSFSTNKNGLIKINTKNSLNDIYLGFAITGKINNINRIVTIEDYNWTWEKVDYNITRRRVNLTRLDEAEKLNPNLTEITEDLIDNLTFTITNLTGKNNNSQLIWQQQYIFDEERNPKLRHTLTNNIGRDITNATFWFVFKLPENFNIRYGGDKFNLNKTGNIRITNERINLNLINPIIDLGEIEFRYADLLKNNFTITDFYVGNGSLIGQPETLITTIGVSKGNGILANGKTIILDPEVTAYKSPTRTGNWFNQWTNGMNIKVSDNAYAYVTTDVTNPRLSSDLYGFDSVLPANSTIVGIEIQVEGDIESGTCID